MHQDQPTFEVDGPAIRKRRMEAGLNIAQLAKAAGISASYLSHIEVGTRRRMGPHCFAALRTALDAQSSDLLLAACEEVGPEGSTRNDPPQDAPRRP